VEDAFSRPALKAKDTLPLSRFEVNSHPNMVRRGPEQSGAAAGISKTGPGRLNADSTLYLLGCSLLLAPRLPFTFPLALFHALTAAFLVT